MRTCPTYIDQTPPGTSAPSLSLVPPQTPDAAAAAVAAAAEVVEP